MIAEVKRRSPSKGAIDAALDAVDAGRAYARRRRGGDLASSRSRGTSAARSTTCAQVRAALRIPVLKKDFHVAPIQLLEARALGASAALLIARALAPERLRRDGGRRRGLGLELLVEVRDEDELQRALDAGATMIGVNNRNLETLVIDAATAERIIPLIPPAVVAVAESGVRIARRRGALRARAAPTRCSWARCSRRRPTRRRRRARSPAWRGGPVAVEVKICGLTRAVDAECGRCGGRGVPRRDLRRRPAHALARGGARHVSPAAAPRKVGVFADAVPGRDRATWRRTWGSTSCSCTATPTPERVLAVRARDGAEVWAVVRTADGTRLPAHVDELADAADALLLDALVAGRARRHRRGGRLGRCSASRSTPWSRGTASCSPAGSAGERGRGHRLRFTHDRGRVVGRGVRARHQGSRAHPGVRRRGARHQRPA